MTSSLSITQGTKGLRSFCLMVFGSYVILRSILTENCFGISFSSHHKVGIRSKALSTEEENMSTAFDTFLCCNFNRKLLRNFF
mmetsp:Transcript_29942/g.33562  ORF Transcript_29942/g.33562 Transcript_29942/m.33562 type:complete len:83 (-) Transcript_29942:182-430(-)